MAWIIIVFLPFTFLSLIHTHTHTHKHTHTHTPYLAKVALCVLFSTNYISYFTEPSAFMILFSPHSNCDLGTYYSLFGLPWGLKW